MTAPELHLLIVGGSTHHPGGIEAFCQRSTAALRRRGGWRIATEPANTAYLKIRTLRRLWRGIAAIVRARRSRLDCVWLQYGNMPDLAYLVVAKALGMRVMVTPHLGAAWRSQSNPVLRAISGRLLALADRIALISPTQETELRIHPRVPRSQIRNFLPEELLDGRVAGREGPPALRLIHSGRLSEGKGSFLVVELCARLRDLGVPFEARITGGATRETYARLARLIAERGLDDRVSVLGRVSDHALYALLRESDLLIHLSRIDSYPLITLEAMACSTLPVCLELAGARDQIETYGGRVVSEAHAVAEAADWLAAIDLDELRGHGLAAARRVRADYAWERCGAAVDEALRACVAGGRRTGG